MYRLKTVGMYFLVPLPTINDNCYLPSQRNELGTAKSTLLARQILVEKNYKKIVSIV